MYISYAKIQKHPNHQQLQPHRILQSEITDLTAMNFIKLLLSTALKRSVSVFALSTWNSLEDVDHFGELTGIQYVPSCK